MATDEHGNYRPSTFPTMGTEAAHAGNASGAPSPNTHLLPKKNTQAGAVPGVKADRKGVLERNGFAGAPQVMRVYPNAPEAALNGRNVRLMPSAKGNRDFYARRAEAAPISGAPLPDGSWPVLKTLGR